MVCNVELLLARVLSSASSRSASLAATGCVDIKTGRTEMHWCCNGRIAEVLVDAGRLLMLVAVEAVGLTIAHLALAQVCLTVRAPPGSTRVPREVPVPVTPREPRPP